MHRRYGLCWATYFRKRTRHGFGFIWENNFCKRFNTIDQDILKVTIFDSQGQCFEHVKGLSKYEDNLYIIAAEENWIDITHKDVDKGKTIRFLQNLLNISSEQTIVFGDGLNDIPLFRHARYKVAMDNAYPELKSKANLSSINNDIDGVIETWIHYL